jgi:steroid delta-isomerase-like uncharacterized protein
MSSEANKLVIQQWAEAIARHDLHGIGEVLTENAVMRVPLVPEPLVGRDAIRQLFAGFFTALSDFRPEIQEQISEGDRVVTHALFLGTNDGEFMGMPPSGNAVKLDVIHIDTVRDGLIHDDFVVLDRAALMEQIQATPDVASATR